MPDTLNDDTTPAGTPTGPTPPEASAPTPGSPAAAPPVDAAIPEGWQPLPTAARKVGMITGALAALPVAIALTIAPSVLFATGVYAGVGLFVAMVAVVAVAGALLARARWRRTRWRLDARGLQVGRGIVWQSEVLVPRSRVQHIDIERGPIERRFGLATLVVHTAGTRLNALRQSGFVDADAVALRDALLPEAASGDDEL